MKVALAGAGGRMGRTLIEALLADRELTLGCAFDVPGSPAVGTKAGAVTIGADSAAAASCDVLIDFTSPESVHWVAHLSLTLPSWTRKRA